MLFSRIPLGVSVFIALASSCAAHALPPEPADQVVGFPFRGELSNPTQIADAGPGFVHIFRNRNHSYASQGLIQIVTEAAAKIQSRFPKGERLQIADLSAYFGGEIPRHRSHQNGLDADVVFYRIDHAEQLDDDGTYGLRESFVTPDRRASPNFDAERNWELIKILNDSGRLQKIFMHPALKKALAAQARAKGEQFKHSQTLAKIAPLNNHDDHMHVRFTCPASSPRCGKTPGPSKQPYQDPTPPADSGPLGDSPIEYPSIDVYY